MLKDIREKKLRVLSLSSTHSEARDRSRTPADMASPILRFINAHHVLNTMVRIVRHSLPARPPCPSISHRRPQIRRIDGAPPPAAASHPSVADLPSLTSPSIHAADPRVPLMVPRVGQGHVPRRPRHPGALGEAVRHLLRRHPPRPRTASRVARPVHQHRVLLRQGNRRAARVLRGPAGSARSGRTVRGGLPRANAHPPPLRRPSESRLDPVQRRRADAANVRGCHHVRHRQRQQGHR